MNFFKFRSRWILFFMLILFSCRGPMDSPVTETGHFHEVLGEGIFSFNDLTSSLLSVYPTMDITSLDNIMRLVDILDTTLKVQSTAISYTTKDPNGSEILASGLIMRPAGRRSKGMYGLSSAKIDKGKAGSEILFAFFEGSLSFSGIPSSFLIL